MPQKPIQKEALKELQDALGEKNASADPGLIEVYSYMNSFMSALFGVWWISPVAVTLPSSTEEVGKVLQICKKYGLKAKPQATTWMFTSLACTNDVVILDLRRMNELVEINEKDGYVVLDPVCTSGVQQVEVMKKGLNCHVNGAGPNACILPSATSVQGSGGTSQSMSNSERNCLGVEMVTTEGDIVYFGSPGTPNAGWFCGDGPGPSLRGMMRGAIGNLGGNGVFTRCGAKCYPWYNPPMDCHGKPPFFEVTTLPNFEIRNIIWPDWEREADALYRISEAELTDYFARLGPGAYEEVMSTTNEEYMCMQDSELYYNTFPKGAWTASIAGSCPEELEARLKTLEHIVEDTGGIVIDIADLGTEVHSAMYQTTLRGCYIFKAAFMPTGSWGCFTPMSYETIDNILKVNQPVNEDIKKRLFATEAIEFNGVDNTYMSLDEHGHFGHCESAFQLDFWEPKEECLSGFVIGVMEGVKNRIPILYSPMPTNGRELLDYTKYIGKVQMLIDPSGTMDSMMGSLMTIMKDLDDIDELQALGEIPQLVR
ncbi:MAG: FAD-binding oxidoreductase [Actinobacteria bacterium]|nr:FAD-binding oxidoreductase [Actinomycetota bacterium]